MKILKIWSIFYFIFLNIRSETMDFVFTMDKKKSELKLANKELDKNDSKENKMNANEDKDNITEDIDKNSSKKNNDLLLSNDSSVSPPHIIPQVIDLSGILNEMIKMNKINKKKLRQRKKNAKLRKKQEIVNLKRKLKLEKLERENIENKLKEINVPKKVKKNRNKNKKARKAFLGGMNDDIEQKLSLKETEFGIMKIQESANETSNQWLFTSAEKARGLRTKTKGITQSLEGMLRNLIDGIDSICGNHEAMEKYLKKKIGR